MTTVINLYGGPGTGKSTLAAEIFYKMKSTGVSCELVREYVKDWAWTNRGIKPFDQLYILGKQSNKESLLYNKVPYIVTDSPVFLAGFYGEHYTKGNEFITDAARGFIKLAEEHDVKHVHYFLKRNKPYDPNGRYENEAQAKELDVKLKHYLERNSVNYEELDIPDDTKADYIIKGLSL